MILAPVNTFQVFLALLAAGGLAARQEEEEENQCQCQHWWWRQVWRPEQEENHRQHGWCWCEGHFYLSLLSPPPSKAGIELCLRSICWFPIWQVLLPRGLLFQDILRNPGGKDFLQSSSLRLAAAQDSLLSSSAMMFRRRRRPTFEQRPGGVSLTKIPQDPDDNCAGVS